MEPAVELSQALSGALPAGPSPPAQAAAAPGAAFSPLSAPDPIVGSQTVAPGDLEGSTSVEDPAGTAPTGTEGPAATPGRLGYVGEVPGSAPSGYANQMGHSLHGAAGGTTNGASPGPQATPLGPSAALPMLAPPAAPLPPPTAPMPLIRSPQPETAPAVESAKGGPLDSASGFLPEDSIGDLDDWEERLFSHFRVVGMIGKGAMGRVFRADDINLKRPVALKIFPKPHLAGKQDVRIEQFLREARAAAQIRHPHVITVYEVGHADNWYYIAMELVEGTTLADEVKRNGRLDPARACRLMADAADGLAAAHAMGVIHRDIKPSNLMVTDHDRLVVADFGLAKVHDPTDPLGWPKEAVGTPIFTSPEVASGMPATPSSDLYSLGATMFYVLTGQPPFKGKTRREVLAKHIHDPVPSPRAIVPALPDQIARIVMNCMAKDPVDRYPDARTLASVLRCELIALWPEMLVSSPELGTTSALYNSYQRLTVDAESRSRSIWLLVAAVFAGVLVGVGGTLLVTGNKGHSAPVTTVQSPR